MKLMMLIFLYDNLQSFRIRNHMKKWIEESKEKTACYTSMNHTRIRMKTKHL